MVVNREVFSPDLKELRDDGDLQVSGSSRLGPSERSGKLHNNKVYDTQEVSVKIRELERCELIESDSSMCLSCCSPDVPVWLPNIYYSML